MSEYADGGAEQVAEPAADHRANGETFGQQQDGQQQGGQQTGDERVDAALSRLAGLGDLPLAAQVTVFDDVHRLLQDALTAGDPTGSAATGAAGAGTASR